MFCENTFQIVCSFLKPTELMRTIQLNKLYYQWTKNVLSKINNCINIESSVCPKCGNWLNEGSQIHDDEYDDLVIYDYHIEIQNRRQLIKKLFQNKQYSRKILLCDDCDLIETEEQRTNFRYRGSRKYSLIIIRNPYFSWSVLCLNDKKRYYWNQYKLFIDQMEFDWENDEPYSHIQYINYENLN